MWYARVQTRSHTGGASKCRQCLTPLNVFMGRFLPFFLIPHFLTGVIYEVRQMIPLAFMIIPMALEIKTDPSATPLIGKYHITLMPIPKFC